MGFVLDSRRVDRWVSGEEVEVVVGEVLEEEEEEEEEGEEEEEEEEEEENICSTK